MSRINTLTRDPYDHEGVWDYLYELGRAYYSLFGEDAVFKFDEVTGALVVIDVAHHEVHEKEMFNGTDNVATGTARDLLIVTGAKYVHMSTEIVADGKVKTLLYKSTTTSASGTSIPTFNKNDASNLTAVATIFHTPTVTAAGTLMDTILTGSGAKAGGISRSTDERVLKPNSKYLYRAAFAANTDVVHRFTFYEESTN
jgi:hypothetical protein